MTLKQHAHSTRNPWGWGRGKGAAAPATAAHRGNRKVESYFPDLKPTSDTQDFDLGESKVHQHYLNLIDILEGWLIIWNYHVGPGSGSSFIGGCESTPCKNQLCCFGFSSSWVGVKTSWYHCYVVVSQNDATIIIINGCCSNLFDWGICMRYHDQRGKSLSLVSSIPGWHAKGMMLKQISLQLLEFQPLWFGKCRLHIHGAVLIKYIESLRLHTTDPLFWGAPCGNSPDWSQWFKYNHHHVYQ